MTTHTLVARQTIPAPLDEVFAFFARPENLGRVLPPSLAFDLRSSDMAMRSGLQVTYRVRPLAGVPVTWVSRIDSYDPPHGFVDSQLKGPYRSWVHAHAFEGTDGDAATLVTDSVRYELPLGRLGSLAHDLVVRNELEHVFRYRSHILAGVFAHPEPNPEPMHVAVAGGTGFVGGGIAAELFRRGHTVTVLSHRGEPARGALPDSVEIRLADATRAGGLTEALAGAEALVIALAFPNSPMESPRQGRTFELVDATGTANLVAAAARAGVSRVVYLSGAGAAPDAPKHWFRAKWRAEEAVRASGLIWTIIRPTWIYGPRDVSLNRFLRFARQYLAVPMTNLGRQLMSPVFIGDAAALAADALADAAAVNQVFELGGPEVLSMHDVIKTALGVADLKRLIIPGPAPLLKLAAAPLTLLGHPPLTPDAVDFINAPATVDIGPLLERMPRRLTPFAEGLASYLALGAGPGTISIDGP